VFVNDIVPPDIEPTNDKKMTALRPPVPTPPKNIMSFISAFKSAQRDLLSVLPEVVYKTYMGKHRLGLRHVYIVNDPEMVRHVLADNVDNYPKSQQMYRALTALVGDGIFISNGATWKRQRKMIDPAFVNVRLRRAFPSMMQTVEDFIDRLKAIDPQSEMKIDEEMAHVTADIIFRAIFSDKLTKEVSNAVFKAFADYQATLPQLDFMEMIGMPDWFPRRSMHKTNLAGQKIRGVIRSLIEARLNDQSGRQYDDILQVLVDARDEETGAGFELEELVDHVGVLFLAGHETSASTLTWAAYLIAQAPDIADRLTEEVDRVWTEPQLAYAQVPEMKLTRNVFRETLRLYPPVSFITREAIAKDEMRGYAVKPGSMMVISPWIIHRHEIYWERPGEFDPDRYATPSGEASYRKSYVPFGMGARVCSGASFAMTEGTLILAALMRNFRLELLNPEEILPVCRLTTRPSVSPRFRILPRN